MAYSNNSILEGNELFIYDGYTAIAFATNSTLSINSETSEASHKDVDGGWESSEVTALSWSASSENLFTLTDYKTLFNKMIAKTAITLKFALPVTVDSTTTYKGYTGTAYIESLEVNAPNGDNATYTVNFTGAGALVKLGFGATYTGTLNASGSSIVYLGVTYTYTTSNKYVKGNSTSAIAGAMVITIMIDDTLVILYDVPSAILNGTLNANGSTISYLGDTYTYNTAGVGKYVKGTSSSATVGTLAYTVTINGTSVNLYNEGISINE